MGDILSIRIPPLNPPQGSTCPFVYASNVFTEEQLDSIEDMVDMNSGTQFNDEVKKSWVTLIGYDENSHWLFSQLSKVVHQLNKNDIEGPEALMKVMKDAVSKH